MTMIHRLHAGATALVFIASGLAGCLGDGSSATSVAPAAGTATLAAAPAPAASAPAPAAPAPAPSPAPTMPAMTGALNLRIAGLPAGAEADVTVSGPGMTALTLTASKTIAGLAPGAYSVTAGEVLTSQAVMAPSTAALTVNVTGGATTDANVAYGMTAAFGLKLDEVISSGLTAPIYLASPPGDPRLFIAERAGKIRVVENGVLRPDPFLDVSARTTTGGERGLLSFAFHPQYAANGFVFVHFTDAGGNIVVERYSVSADPNVALPTGATVITIPHPTFDNHNGGRVTFGKDGYLYLSTGDGGGGGDPDKNAQDTRRLLGKLLRLDVSVSPYRIPPSNPFAGLGRGEEIWALGLRNPWRFAFDDTANRLYIADVGQGRREEIDVVATDAAGVNYGWPITEGTLCYPNDPCNRAGQVAPVFDYDHNEGCSITGGYVYRGTAIPQLRGRYLYSDYCSGWLRSLRSNGGPATERIDWNIANVGRVVSFGEDAGREVYVLTAGGKVYRIARK